MKYFVRYQERKLNGKIDSALGSDSVFILDGRNKLETMVNDAWQNWIRKKSVTSFCGFKIFKSPCFDESNCIYDSGEWSPIKT